jgi:FMN phosphatase YigB (HAD superfamily)
MIKAVIFDFFGVLALRNSASFRQTYYPEDSEKTNRTKKIQDDLGRGDISYDDYIDGLARIGGVDREVVLKYTEEYQSNIELLEYIRNHLKPNYKLGIISNAGADWDIMTYCQGAESAGMKTVWYHDFQQMRKQLEKILPADPDN